jgi:hypothetical protein
MPKKMRMQAISIACIIAAGSLQPVFAQTASSYGSIVAVNTGWSADEFGVSTTTAVVNPAGCPYTDGYIINSSEPGYNTFYAAVLTALSTGLQIAITVSNTQCTSGRPTIIAVSVYNS